MDPVQTNILTIQIGIHHNETDFFLNIQSNSNPDHIDQAISQATQIPVGSFILRDLEYGTLLYTDSLIPISVERNKHNRRFEVVKIVPQEVRQAMQYRFQEELTMNKLASLGLG